MNYGKNNGNVAFYGEKESEYEVVASDESSSDDRIEIVRDYDGNVMDSRIDPTLADMTSKTWKEAQKIHDSKAAVLPDPDLNEKKRKEPTSQFQQSPAAIGGQFTGLSSISEGKTNEKVEEYDKNVTRPGKRATLVVDGEKIMVTHQAKLIDPDNSLLSFMAIIAGKLGMELSDVIDDQTHFPKPQIQGMMTDVMYAILDIDGVSNEIKTKARLIHFVYDDGEDIRVRRNFARLIGLGQTGSHGSAYGQRISSNGGMTYFLSANHKNINTANDQIATIHQFFHTLRWHPNPRLIATKYKLKRKAQKYAAFPTPALKMERNALKAKVKQLKSDMPRVLRMENKLINNFYF